jgi:hypothetical protein
MRALHPCPAPIAGSAFAGFCFPSDVIVLAVRWSLRFGLLCRDVEGVAHRAWRRVDHVTIYRWVLRVTPLPADAARPCRLGGPVAGVLAPHRPVRQQPGRVRPREAEGAAASDARPQQDRSAKLVIAGHAFVQNLRRGHYELVAHPRDVITDPQARYFGAELNERTLIPAMTPASPKPDSKTGSAIP